MLELSEVKDYWCIVAIDDECCGIVLKQSEDSKNDDIAPEWTINDNCFEGNLEDLDGAGVYKLTLEVINDDNGDIDVIKIAKIEQLYKV
jgi:hypothetical protein